MLVEFSRELAANPKNKVVTRAGFEVIGWVDWTGKTARIDGSVIEYEYTEHGSGFSYRASTDSKGYYRRNPISFHEKDLLIETPVVERFLNIYKDDVGSILTSLQNAIGVSVASEVAGRIRIIYEDETCSKVIKVEVI